MGAPPSLTTDNCPVGTWLLVVHSLWESFFYPSVWYYWVGNFWKPPIGSSPPQNPVWPAENRILAPPVLRNAGQPWHFVVLLGRLLLPASGLPTLFQVSVIKYVLTSSNFREHLWFSLRNLLKSPLPSLGWMGGVFPSCLGDVVENNAADSIQRNLRHRPLQPPS